MVSAAGNRETRTGSIYSYMKNKRINGRALEVIMRDVLEGMQDYTVDSCASCASGKLQILSLEKPDCRQSPLANIIPFPLKNRR